jgi:hypothetical protein
VSENFVYVLKAAAKRAASAPACRAAPKPSARRGRPGRRAAQRAAVSKAAFTSTGTDGTRATTRTRTRATDSTAAKPQPDTPHCQIGGRHGVDAARLPLPRTSCLPAARLRRKDHAHHSPYPHRARGQVARRRPSAITVGVQQPPRVTPSARGGARIRSVTSELVFTRTSGGPGHGIGGQCGTPSQVLELPGRRSRARPAAVPRPSHERLDGHADAHQYAKAYRLEASGDATVVRTQRLRPGRHRLRDACRPA